ncbi:hypothetical protein TNCV_2884801 [Trichonephila clavipes]|nr:hypothetical protein TNCV_2884801 [Trichonephila clavipes]
MSSCAEKQFHSDASLEAVDQRAPNNSKNWRRMAEGDVSARHLFSMAVNDHTASFRQLAALWSTAIAVLMSASSLRRRLLHHGLRAIVPLYRIPPLGKPSMAACAMSSWA